MGRFGLAEMLVVMAMIGCGPKTGGEDKTYAGGDIPADGNVCGGSCVKIDGMVTGWPDCKEFCAPPVNGVYGDLYYQYDAAGWLQILNDWHLRNDEPTPDGCYNLFKLATGGGDEMWEVRVFGNGTLKVLLNGKPYEDATLEAEGAAGFGPSPTNAMDHAMYEFRLPVSPGTFFLTECDPAAGPPTPGVGGSFVCAMEWEPTGFTGELKEGGGAEVSAASGPILAGLVPNAGRPGDSVVVMGAGFGKDGTVSFGGLPATVTSWTPNEAAVVVPAIYADVLVGLKTTPGTVTNQLLFRLCEPGCDDKECGPDECGGVCGFCGPGFTCEEDGSCVCQPDCEGKPCGVDDGCGDTCGICPMMKCTSHGECWDGLLCLGGPEDSALMEVCGLCGDTDGCFCKVPTWPAEYACGTDADCEKNLPCGDQCDDCPVTCPKCVHGWCAYETFDIVECLCTGCA